MATNIHRNLGSSLPLGKKDWKGELRSRVLALYYFIYIFLKVNKYKYCVYVYMLHIYVSK